ETDAVQRRAPGGTSGDDQRAGSCHQARTALHGPRNLHHSSELQPLIRQARRRADTRPLSARRRTVNWRMKDVEREKKNRAVVIGGSMAGMMAARVLADSFQQVIVLERDTLPENAESRAGVPQAKHLHALLPRGRRILEKH